MAYGIWASLPVTAQQNVLEWTLPAPISQESEYAFQPVITADESGTVHAFWTAVRAEYRAESAAILYARYQNGAWTSPVDILISPNGQDAVGLRTLVDDVGRIHLFWSTPASNSPFGPVYHSWAPANAAESVHNWQTPIQISQGTYQSDVALAPDGRLHLVYASVTDSQGICHISSEDHGDSWGAQTCLPHFAALRDQETESRPRIAIDSHGYLHVVWVLDDYSRASKLRYPGRGVYYARSTDGGETWKDMQAVEEVDGREANALLIDQPEWPMIAIDKDDRVHIVWVSGTGGMKRYHQWSNDSGVTWSSPQVAIPSIFYNGWMGLAVDGEGVLHFVTAGDEGISYSRWNGIGWTPRVRFRGDVGGAHYVGLAVSLGNELHVVWQNHGYSNGFEFSQDEEGRIMHAMMLTEARRTTPRPLPTVQPTAQPTPAPSINPEEKTAATPIIIRPTLAPNLPPPASPSNPGTPILVGLLAPVILAGLIAVVIARKR